MGSYGLSLCVCGDKAEQLNHTLYEGDCLDILPAVRDVDTVFADPPDNINLKYARYQDNLHGVDYVRKLRRWISLFVRRARTVWVSYNVRWTFDIGLIVHDLLDEYKTLQARHCVQTFTFGQHNHRDLCNNHRPLLRLRFADAPLFPDAIRVQSWRQKNGDKRADPRGRVPGDVFDFPRVTGNSKQRRSWCPTQLHEGLVERCLKLTTPEGGKVLDPFAGSGTTLRVCKRLGIHCTLIELDETYCDRICEEHSEVDRLGG